MIQVDYHPLLRLYPRVYWLAKVAFFLFMTVLFGAFTLSLAYLVAFFVAEETRHGIRDVRMVLESCSSIPCLQDTGICVELAQDQLSCSSALLNITMACAPAAFELINTCDEAQKRTRDRMGFGMIVLSVIVSILMPAVVVASGILTCVCYATAVQSARQPPPALEPNPPPEPDGPP